MNFVDNLVNFKVMKTKTYEITKFYEVSGQLTFYDNLYLHDRDCMKHTVYNIVCYMVMFHTLI